KRWIVDPDSWSLFPPEEMSDDYCHFAYADADKLGLPRLAWESCGEGCEKADLLQGLSTYASKPLLGMSRGSGQARPYLFLHQGTLISPDERWVSVNRIIDLESGATEAAFKLDASEVSRVKPCHYGDADRQAPPFSHALWWSRSSLEPSFGESRRTFVT